MAPSVTRSRDFDYCEHDSDYETIFERKENSKSIVNLYFELFEFFESLADSSPLEISAKFRVIFAKMIFSFYNSDCVPGMRRTEDKKFKEFSAKVHGLIAQFASSISAELALEILNIGFQGEISLKFR